MNATMCHQVSWFHFQKEKIRKLMNSDKSITNITETDLTSREITMVRDLQSLIMKPGKVHHNALRVRRRNMYTHKRDKSRRDTESIGLTTTTTDKMAKEDNIGNIKKEKKAIADNTNHAETMRVVMVSGLTDSAEITKEMVKAPNLVTIVTRVAVKASIKRATDRNESITVPIHKAVISSPTDDKNSNSKGTDSKLTNLEND